MSYLALSHLFEYIFYGYTTTINIEFFQLGDRLYESESDVYRRQILTDGPSAERVNEDTCNINCLSLLAHLKP